MTNPSTAPIYELTRALVGEEAITVQWADSEATTITDDIFALSDGLYEYRLIAYGALGDLSTTSDPYYIQIENGVIVSYPQKDVSSLSVQPTTGGKFILFWKQENSAIQNPTHFNMYYNVNPSAEEWILDGTASLSLYSHYLYQYTTETSFENGAEVSFKVLPSVDDGSNEYEKSSDSYTSAAAVLTVPVITEYIISIE